MEIQWEGLTITLSNIEGPLVQISGAPGAVLPPIIVYKEVDRVSSVVIKL